MASAGQSVIRHLRRAAAITGGDEPADESLLHAFALRRDEAAFTALVRRHGPMVLAVCRRVVGRHADAEDAFQATFLVLARKAASLDDPQLLAGWLHGVACRTALEARTRMLRRTARETPLHDLPNDDTHQSDAERAELLALLDRELGRLADKYRVPVVMCELEGRSRKDVAELLGIPEGTLSSRLAAARRLLAARLTRRGIAVSVSAVAAILSHREASAALPARLLNATVAGAASGQVPAAVSALTQGVLKIMFLKKLQLSAVLFAALGLSLGLVTIGAMGGKQATAQPEDKPKPPDVKPGEAATGLLVGGWKIEKMTFGGREKPVDGNGLDAIFFTKDKGSMLEKSGAGASFEYKLDTSRKPAQIDLMLNALEVQGTTSKLQGIVELSGDTLKLCFSEGKDERPESFESKEGSRLVLIQLKRDKTVKEPDPKTANEKMKIAALRMRSSNNLKQMALALHNFHDATGKLPTAAILKDGKPMLSWRVAILPYIEQDQLYKQFKLDEPWDSEHNKKLAARMPKIYGDNGTDKTHYRVFHGKGTAFEGADALKFTDFTDGTSNTILIAEAVDPVTWTKPDELMYDAEKPLPKLGGKPFADIFMAAFADGSVRAISMKVDEKSLRAHITRNGGEVIENKPEEE